VTDTLTVNGDSTLGNGDSDVVILRGHVRRKTAAPSIARPGGGALGTGGSVDATILGTDQAGSINLVAGTTSLTTGTAATITFATARPDTNYSIGLTARGATAGANAVGVYVVAVNTTTWDIRFAAAPGSGNTLPYFYRIDEWTN
jgi:hypothetical protein